MRMPPIKPPMWPPHEMPENVKLKTKIDDDERHRLATESAGCLPLDDQHRAEDPEDRARRADDRCDGVADKAPAEPARPDTKYRPM